LHIKYRKFTEQQYKQPNNCQITKHIGAICFNVTNTQSNRKNIHSYRVDLRARGNLQSNPFLIHHLQFVDLRTVHTAV